MRDGEKLGLVRLYHVHDGKWLTMKKSALHRDPRIAMVSGARDAPTGVGTMWKVIHISRATPNSIRGNERKR